MPLQDTDLFVTSRVGANYQVTSSDVAKSDLFPIGTRTLWVQATAPLGWTQTLDNNQRTVRIVSGGTGGTQYGTIPYDTIFVPSYSFNANVPGATLILAAAGVAVPSHGHGGSGSGCPVNAGYTFEPQRSVGTESNDGSSSSSGGGGGHIHPYSANLVTQPGSSGNFNIKYTNCIECVRN